MRGLDDFGLYNALNRVGAKGIEPFLERVGLIHVVIDDPHLLSGHIMPKLTANMIEESLDLLTPELLLKNENRTKIWEDNQFLWKAVKILTV